MSKIVATLLFCPSKISPSLTKRGHITAMAVPHQDQNFKFIKLDMLAVHYPVHQ